MVATLYEAREDVGGAWLLSEDAGECNVSFDEQGDVQLKSPEEDGDGPPPPTSMYPSLHTNVPSTLMEYRGRPFASTVVRCLAELERRAPAALWT